VKVNTLAHCESTASAAVVHQKFANLPRARTSDRRREFDDLIDHAGQIFSLVIRNARHPLFSDVQSDLSVFLLVLGAVLTLRYLALAIAKVEQAAESLDQATDFGSLSP
jgi:hypothetical protein